MCPFCLATAGLIAAGATSAGGLTVLAVILHRKKNDVTEISNSDEKTKEQ